jgi:putative MATE family efflux protein
MSARPPEEDATAQVEEDLAELGDPETSSSLPSGALARHSASAVEDVTPSRGTSQEIWNLAWPVILSQVMASLVGLVDIAMVGRLGRAPVAAVGYVTQYLWLTQSVIFAIGIACVALMSRAIGAGDLERARAAHAASIVVAFATAAVVTLVVLVAPGSLLALLEADASVIELGIPYMRLTLGSTLILSIAIVMESALRADKDTRTPMQIALVATLVKAGLNGILIFGLLGFPRLELVGAGLATVASQVVAIGLFVVASLRRPLSSPVRLGWSDLKKSRAMLPEVMRISVPAVAERVVMNGAMMAYFTFIGSYGTAAIAAYTIGIRVLSFSWIPGVGFSTASSTLVGQALGAGDPEGAARAGWRAVQMALAVSIVLGGIFAAGRVPLAMIFTNDVGVIDELGPFMLVLALAQPLMGLHFTLGGALRGAGDTVTPLVAATVGNWALRVPIAFFCATVLETPVIWIWCALVFDHLARAIWLMVAFQRGSWKSRVGA